MNIEKALEELILQRCEWMKNRPLADTGEELKGIAELVRALNEWREGGWR